jgi:hypothetical protein
MDTISESFWRYCYIVKTATKLQAKLRNRRVPGIFLGPAEDHMGDTYTSWNPITKHAFESRSAIFLLRKYADFHELEKSQITKQFATITDELNELFDEDEDVTPENEAGDHLSNQMNNEDYEEVEDSINIKEDMQDPTNPELT